MNLTKSAEQEKVKKTTINQRVYSLHIQKAIAYIEKNITEDLSLDEVVDYLKLNKTYFCKLFKENTGKTFSQYVNELRVEYSKKLLEETNLSILDIALAVGYNNSNYFHKAFKERLGVTPYNYRQLTKLASNS
ncbi:MAG: helix-turn-helix transcriptional regulator [Desulfitobacterium sp.]|nr:helix-turn-helix transcriptional regulator [Desulfitobacterium sp.]